MGLSIQRLFLRFEGFTEGEPSLLTRLFVKGAGHLNPRPKHYFKPFFQKKIVGVLRAIQAALRAHITRMRSSFKKFYKII
jgi:hypothetical protein